MTISLKISQFNLRQLFFGNRGDCSCQPVYEALDSAYLDTISRLMLAVEYKDPETGGHILRMSQYSALIAKNLGMAAQDVQLIYYAAPMHDVGKIGIPDHILMKPAKLTPEEFEMMKMHTLIGGKILAQSKSKVLACAHRIALSHHERWDGTGYPYGLTGQAIPLVGRIVALADVFDALTSARPYKEAFSVERAISMIQQERGYHFDPMVVDIFLDSLDEVKQIRKNTASILTRSPQQCSIAALNELLQLEPQRSKSYHPTGLGGVDWQMGTSSLQLN